MWLATSGLLQADQAPPEPPSNSEHAFSISQAFGDRPATVLDNSPTFSQINQISPAGHAVGVREVAEEGNTVFRFESFIWVNGRSPQLALVDGYTNWHAEAIADNGTAVGYQSRVPGSGAGSLIPVCWDGHSGAVVRLPLPAGSTSGHAQDISADGHRVSGYVSGANPSHLQPCLWTRAAEPTSQQTSQQADQALGQWTVQKLPTEHAINPYTMSSAVRISPDGQRIVACCTDRIVQGLYDNSLFVWQQDDQQHWQRSLLSPESLYVNDVTDAGEIVGTMTRDGVRRAVFVSAQGELTLIPLLPGDESSSANGINAAGLVVGNSEDAYGPDGGPQAFAWDSTVADAAPQSLPMGDGPFSTAMTINDRGQIGGTALVSLASGGERSLAYRTDDAPAGDHDR